MTTRQEHLQFCKDRAMEYVKAGDLLNAVTSMMSDLNKHPETESNWEVASDAWPHGRAAGSIRRPRWRDPLHPRLQLINCANGRIVYGRKV